MEKGTDTYTSKIYKNATNKINLFLLKPVNKYLITYTQKTSVFTQTYKHIHRKIYKSIFIYT